MGSVLIQFSFYCLEYSKHLEKSIDALYDRDNLDYDKYTQLRKQIELQKIKPKIDAFIRLLENSHFINEVGLNSQNFNIISPTCLRSSDNETEIIKDFLISCDLYFILHNKLWKAPHSVEMQIEIIHEDELYKYYQKLK